MITIHMKKDYPDDYISRKVGEKLRKRILEAFHNGEKVEIDFTGLTIASTSFFDEGIAKLFEEGWNHEMLKKWVFFKSLNPRDHDLLENLLRKRGGK